MEKCLGRVSLVLKMKWMRNNDKYKEFKLEQYLHNALWQHKAWDKINMNKPSAGWTKHPKVIAVSAVTSNGLTLRTLTTCFMNKLDGEQAKAQLVPINWGKTNIKGDKYAPWPWENKEKSAQIDYRTKFSRLSVKWSGFQSEGLLKACLEV